ncbi:SNase-domain-containing protein [Sporormia fimetaria CBS 119925]|uniref:Probable endonuclease LCL3 n=1 Tax=Sporormia fimetaria CBS 119925 TaxID=1340428 RepID=A0A6A6VMD4_9PLEO|nr:SNase-domain-containing protein [Sporormia fimetaria CBS 119925]
MRWPAPGDNDTSGSKGDTKRAPSQWTWSWANLTKSETLVPSIVFTITTISAVRIYKSYLRRIPNVNHIKPGYFRQKSIYGYVTSVGDADNFRIFHTPGGRSAGWGWLPWKRVPTEKAQLAGKTIHIRIAGVDAPELAHWGRAAQPYSTEALNWLTSYILHRPVRAYLFRRDQYDRVVAQVYVRRWFIRRDVGLEMLKCGFATVYEAKSGAEFGDFEKKYREAEEQAKRAKVGMWAKPGLLQRLRGETGVVLESPREYKNRHAAADAKKAGTEKKVVEKKAGPDKQVK